MIIKYGIALLLTVMPSILLAQKQGQLFIDSLQAAIKQAHTDSDKVKILDNISYTYREINPAKGIEYGHKALVLASSLKWDKGIAVANADIGINHAVMSNHTIALNYDSVALEMYHQMGNLSAEAAVLANMALIYAAKADYSKALEYNLRALSYYDTQKQYTGKAEVLQNIGSIYLREKNYEMARSYYTNATLLYKRLNNNGGEASCLTNLGIVDEALGKYDAALANYYKALVIHQQLNNNAKVQLVLANIGNAFIHKKDYSDALKWQSQALKISRELDMKMSIAINMGNIGETYFMIATDTSGNTDAADKNNALPNAIKYLEEAVDRCGAIDAFSPMMEFQDYLSKAYYLSRKYKQAYDNYLQLIRIKDSVFTMDTKLRINELTAERQLAIKDKDIKIKNEELLIQNLQIQKHRHQMVIYTIGVMLMVLIILIVFKSLHSYRLVNRKLRREQEEHLRHISQQIDHIKKQSALLDEIAHMQSHNVRGPVATILGLVQMFNFEDYSDPTNEVVIKGIGDLAQELDTAIQEVIKKENSAGV